MSTRFMSYPVMNNSLAPPAVSVVIPTYRRPVQMREAVQSVLRQDYSGLIEVIVVFDAGTPEVSGLTPSPTRTIQALPNQRVQGLAGARNTGILAAAHPFVAFLDDDDVWHPCKLSAQMPIFTDHADVLLVGSAMQVDDGHQVHERLVPRDVVTHDDLIRSRLAGLHSSSFVFRRDALIHDIGLVDEKLPGSYGEDYDLLLTTAGLGSIRLVNRPLVTVRWSGQSYYFGKWAAYAEALTYLLSKHVEIARDPVGSARIKSQIAFALAAAGQRGEALRMSLSVLAKSPRQLRAWLAVAMTLRLASATGIGRVAHRFGKGI